MMTRNFKCENTIKNFFAVFYVGVIVTFVLQESLANAKVSVQQQCVYEGP